MWLLLVCAALLVLLVAGIAASRRVQFRSGPTERPCGVYIIPSRGNRPAYVGNGFNPMGRVADHRRDSQAAAARGVDHWWRHVDTGTAPTVEWHPSKDAAEARETYLIRTLAPYGNVKHNLGRNRVVRPAVENHRPGGVHRVRPAHLRAVREDDQPHTAR